MRIQKLQMYNICDHVKGTDLYFDYAPKTKKIILMDLYSL